MRATWTVLIAALVAGGCVMETGGGAREVDNFLRGRGGRVFIEHEAQRREGELIGFRNDTAFVLVGRSLHAVTRQALYARNNEVATFGGQQRASQRNARYEIEITSTLEAQLLAKLGQAATLK